MDIVNFNALQRASRQGFNEFLPERPLFAYYSSYGNVPVIDLFAANQRRSMASWVKNGNNPRQPISFQTWASGQMNSSNWNGYDSSSWTATSSFNYALGYTGLHAHSDTMLLNGLELTAEGVFPFKTSTYEYQTHSGMGLVLGETADYQQGIDLIKYGTAIIVGYVGDQAATTRANEVTLAAFNWTTLAGLSQLASANNDGRGDIAYNRKTNTLAFLQTNQNSGNQIHRLHIFKNLPAKLRASGVHLKAMLEDAIAGKNGSSYETFDFTWNMASNNLETNHATRIIPCDDGTFWFAKLAYSGANQGLNIARITGATGSRVFATVDRIASHSSGVYGREQGDMYGIRQMTSDDQSMVAVYAPYYYYFPGGMFFFLPRSSAAVATKYRKFTQTDTSFGMSIAPYGGPNFILGYASNAVNKWRDGLVMDLANNALDGTALSVSTGFQTCQVTGNYYTTTNYGGNGFVKIQNPLRNTTEWNERAL